MNSDMLRPEPIRGAAPQPIAALILTMCLFVIWGFGQRLFDGLLPQFVSIFHLKGPQAAIGPAVSTTVALAGAIPAALCARSFGYKGAILLGLAVFSIGTFLLYQSAEARSLEYLLSAVAIMSCGWILLEMAANPLIVSLGRRETAVQRLNLAHSLYAPGALLGILLTQWAVTNDLKSSGQLTIAPAHPYIAVGVILLAIAFLIEMVRFPKTAADRVGSLETVGRDLRAVLASPVIRFSVAAQFFTMSAQTSLWAQSRIILGVPAVQDLTSPGYLNGLVLLVAVLAVGRFAGTALMYRFPPERVLAACSAGGIIMSSVAQFVSGSAAVLAILAAGACMAINWPTVIGLGIRDLGSLMKLGVAPICMGGILGGFACMIVTAILFPAQGYVSALISVVSFAVVLWFAIWCGRQGRPVRAGTPVDAPATT